LARARFVTSPGSAGCRSDSRADGAFGGTRGAFDAAGVPASGRVGRLADFIGTGAFAGGVARDAGVPGRSTRCDSTARESTGAER
jgi:hypothetical protein